MILRNVLDPSELRVVREAYEVLVERQVALWAAAEDTRSPWNHSAQPRLNLRPDPVRGASQLKLDETTAAAIEFW